MPPAAYDHHPAGPPPPDQAGPGPAPDYRAYVLRCWREATGWRFGLEDPHTGAQRGFPNLAALVAAVRTDLAGGGSGSGSGSPQRPRRPARPDGTR